MWVQMLSDLRRGQVIFLIFWFLFMFMSSLVIGLVRWKHSKNSTMKCSDFSVLAATSLLINSTNEDVSRGKVIALIRARLNADFAMLPKVSKMFLPSWESKMLFQNIWYWMIHWVKIIFMDIIYVEWQQ